MVLVALALGGCDRRGDSGPVVVSVIGGAPQLRDPARPALAGPDRILDAAVAEGLVRFDAAGQVEPGLAERWTVIDGGMSYIFRLRAATWSDGRPVTAGQVVTILRRGVAAGGPLGPYLTAISEVVEMTPQVIEVRLRRPRPDLLKLFAQPELAIVRRNPPGGAGPFRIAGTVTAAGGVLLRPVRATGEDAAEPDAPPSTRDVRLIGERAARAIARFAAHESDLVSGGTLADWPLLAVADIAPANLRLDPAAGLFGLAVARRDGFLADAANRAALAGAFDRVAILRSFAAGAGPVEALLPDRLDSALPPALPAWAGQPLAARRAEARRRVAAAPARPRIAVALPDGPGATILYGHIAATLAALGIEPARVPLGDPRAGLRLVDAVAPYDSGRWYLATACAPCGEAASVALDRARLAPDLVERARAIAAADAALAADAAFIPIGRPLRWSLVALRLRQWQGNARAWHPLNHLRTEAER